MRIVYRRWKQSDITSICALLHDTWIDTYSKFIPLEDMTEYFQRHYSDSDFSLWMEDTSIVGFIAEVDGTIAGYEKTIFVKEEHRLYIQQLYVLPRYQGMGLGKQLLIFAADHARTFELDRVWLSVMIENTPALFWYQNMGYTIVEKSPCTMGKTQVDHYFGYVPIDDILRVKETRQEIRRRI